MQTEKRIVKIGIGQLDRRMTRDQAMRYGKRHMPADLKRAGFECTIFASDLEINGSLFYRINYGK